MAILKNPVLDQFYAALDSFTQTDRHTHIMSCANLGAFANVQKEEIVRLIKRKMTREPNPTDEVEKAVEKACAEKDQSRTPGATTKKARKSKVDPSPSPKVSMYRDKLDNAGAEADLQALIDGIRLERWKAQVEPVREAVEKGDKEAAETLKGKLPAFIPAGLFSRRSKKALLAHSGIIVADFDKLPSREDADNMVRVLAKDPHIRAAFVSPSGRGVKAFVRVRPCEDAEQHEAAFEALSKYFEETYGVCLDESGKDVSRLCFVSSDPGAFVRPMSEAKVFGPLEGADALQTVEAADYLEQEPPKPDPILDGCFERGDKVELISASKQKKTFFLLFKLLHLAIGRDFLGIKVPKRRRVLYINLELRDTWLHRRIRAACRLMGIHPDELRGWFVVLNARSRGAAVREHLVEIAEREGVDLVAVDPRYKLHLPGEAENAGEGLQGILDLLDLVAEAGPAVLVVHHDPKGDGGDRAIADRGSGSSWAGRDVDCRFCLSPQKDEPETGSVVSIMCRNYPPTADFSIRWWDGIFEPAPDLRPLPFTSYDRKKALAGDTQKTAESFEGAALEIAREAMSRDSLEYKIRLAGASRDAARACIEGLVRKGELAHTPRTGSRNGSVKYGIPQAIREYVNPRLSV